MSNTIRLGLPNLVSGQAQKEITHNMALQRLEAFIQTAVESMSETIPPAGVEGSLYIVAAGATGDWQGKDNYLAHFTGGAWNFYLPFEGMRIWDKASAAAIVYKNDTWQQETAAQAKLGFFGAEPVDKSAVVLGNTENEISGLAIGAAYSQTEVQALQAKCEELSADVRAIHAALSSYGLV